MCSVRIPLKHLPGLVGVFPVTRTEPHSADVEIANLAWDSRAQLTVEHQQPLSVASLANQDLSPLACGALAHAVVTAGNSRFCRTVQVDEGHMRKALYPADQGWHGKFLSAPKQAFEFREIILLQCIECREGNQRGGHREPLRQPGLADEVRKPVR